MEQKETRRYVGQDETRTYFLTQDQMDLVEKYLDGLVEKDWAIQPIAEPLYYILPSVHGGGLLVDIIYDKGIFQMIGDSTSLGRLVSHIEDKRFGRLRAESFFKGEEVQSQ